MQKTLRGHITKLAVDRLIPGQTLRDNALKGFGVRRQQKTASYFLQKNVHGRVRWYTIGPHGSPWTPDSARKEAWSILVSLNAGIDPTKQKQLQRAKPVLREVTAQFMATHGPKLKPRTREEYQRLIDLHITRTFGNKYITDITRGDVAKFHASMADTPAAANFALAVLSKLMRWCEDCGYRPEQSNPCRGVPKYRQNSMERYLTSEEFARLGKVLDQLERENGEDLYVIAAVRLLLLTGARLNEILTLRWTYVDIERHMLRLPDSKTGQKTIRLGGPAIQLLKALPRVKSNPYVIVGKLSGAHLVNLQKPWRHIRTLAGIPDVRIHDLRHTFASQAAANGASLPMIGKLLGHTQAQTTARYTHLADDPLAALNAKVSDTIALALRPKQKPTANGSMYRRRPLRSVTARK
jgi:integrase